MKKSTINFYLGGCSSDPKIIAEGKQKLKSLRGEQRNEAQKNLSRPRSIYVYIRVPEMTKPIKSCTGWQCPQENWTGENVSPKYDGAIFNRISDLITWFEEVTRSRVNGEKEIISMEVLQNKIDTLNGKPERNKLLSEFVPWVENYIKNYNGSVGTKRTYWSTLMHLKEYAAKNKIKLTWNTFNMDFYNNFMEFLYDKGLVDSTTGKIIEHVKVFLSRAFDEDKHTNLNYKKRSFKILTTESDSIALSPEEIEKIYNLKFDDKTEDEQQNLKTAQLLFVLNCWIGVRVSDLNKLRKHHIKNINGSKFIVITTTKTGEDVVIPLNTVAAEILENHGDWLLGKSFEPGDYNELLRELGKLAEFKTMVQKRRTVRGLKPPPLL